MSNSLGARLRRMAEPNKQRKLVIGVDFDGVLHDGNAHHIGRPLPGAVTVLTDAKANGDTVIIHTCRARPSETYDGKYWRNTVAEVADFLQMHKIPFDEITALKPHADVFLDDRALQFINWDLASRDLINLRRTK